MSEWRRTTLGEVATVVGGGTPSTREPSYWQGDVVWLTPTEVVRLDGGFVMESERTITSTGLAASGAKLLPKGTVLLTSRASVGFTAIAGRPLTTNQGFQSLVPSGAVLPRLLMYWIQAHRDEFTTRAGGSTFQEISKRNVASIPISVPPLAEQRRIVDLIGALDAHVAAVGAEGRALGLLLERTVFDLISMPDGNGEPIERALIRNIGGVWGNNAGLDEVDVDVFRSTEFTDWGGLDGVADARRSVTEKQLAGRRLKPGDILVEKSGGTPQRPVGRVVRVTLVDLQRPAIGANFLQLLRVDEFVVDPGYLFWLLWGSHRRGDSLQYQQASTNMRNLKTKAYLARRVQLPPLAEQCGVASSLDAVQRHRRSARLEVNSLRALRRVLLSSLLSQEWEIPPSYEQLLKAAS